MEKYSLTHVEYDRLLPFWERCRHLYMGEDQVKRFAEKNRYLPRPHKMPDNAYMQYRERANLLGLFQSTVEGRMGDVMRKDPLIEADDEINDFFEEMMLNGGDLSALVGSIMRELLITGRVGVLLDVKADGTGFYCSIYKPEDILFWDGGEELQTIVLRETQYDFTENTKREMELRWVLEIEEGKYVARKYGQANAGGWELLDELFPNTRSGALTFIPFVIFNIDHLGPVVGDPPMIHLANLLISLFRNSADYEQGLHALGVPTPVITGIRSDEEAVFHLGPNTPIILEPPDAKVHFLEFSGQGLTQLKAAMDEKVLQAVMMGARLIQQRRQVESAESARTRLGAESSLLNVLVNITEMGIYELTRFFLLWQRGSEDLKNISIELNRDFIDESFSPDVLKSINDAELQGLISPIVAFQLRKKYEIYPDGWTFEEEQENIQSLGQQDIRQKPQISQDAPIQDDVEEELEQ